MLEIYVDASNTNRIKKMRIANDAYPGVQVCSASGRHVSMKCGLNSPKRTWRIEINTKISDHPNLINEPRIKWVLPSNHRQQINATQRQIEIPYTISMLAVPILRIVMISTKWVQNSMLRIPIILDKLRIRKVSSLQSIQFHQCIAC